jgi:hypothetical protein
MAVDTFLVVSRPEYAPPKILPHQVGGGAMPEEEEEDALEAEDDGGPGSGRAAASSVDRPASSALALPARKECAPLKLASWGSAEEGNFESEAPYQCMPSTPSGTTVTSFSSSEASGKITAPQVVSGVVQKVLAASSDLSLKRAPAGSTAECKLLSPSRSSCKSAYKKPSAAAVAERSVRQWWRKLIIKGEDVTAAVKGQTGEDPEDVYVMLEDGNDESTTARLRETCRSAAPSFDVLARHVVGRALSRLSKGGGDQLGRASREGSSYILSKESAMQDSSWRDPTAGWGGSDDALSREVAALECRERDVVAQIEAARRRLDQLSRKHEEEIMRMQIAAERRDAALRLQSSKAGGGKPQLIDIYT